MFSFTTLVSYALLASTVFAVPTVPHIGRHAQLFRPAGNETARFVSARKNGGGGGSGQGGGNGNGNTVTTPAVTTPGTAAVTASAPAASGAVLTSTIWAGVGMESTQNSYKSVTGTLVVPDLQPASGGAASGYYGGSAWVGLDGITCDNLVAAGISFFYLQGTVWGQAWTEAYPNAAVNLPTQLNPGDNLKITITATSTTAVTAVIDNLTTGEVDTIPLEMTAPLCLSNAEWIVEDFQDGTFVIPFADFGSITFTDASATTMSGGAVSPAGGHVINMVQSSLEFASASAGSSSVTVDYLTSIPF